MKENKQKQSKGLKYASIGARILLGLMFVVFGFGYFFMGDVPLDTLSAPARQYFSALLATGFFLPFLKAVEGIAGLMLFFRRWAALALLVLAPIIIQILLFDIFLDGSGLLVGVVCAVLAGFVAWCNWDKYAPLFKA